MKRLAWRTALLLVTLGLLAGWAFPAGAQTTTIVGTPEERAAAIARPGVVYTEQYFRAWVRVPAGSDLNFVGYVNDGQPFEWGTRCSGSVVNPAGYVVTAGHCVDLGEEGARETALQFATQWLIDNGWAFAQDFDFWLNEGHLLWGVEGTERGSEPDFEMWVQRGVAAGGLKTGEAFPARVVDYQPWSQGDIAIVKIEQSDLPTVLVAESADVSIGTPVLSIGYPGSSDAVTDANLEPTFKDGQINSEKTREGGLLPVYEMSAALSGGMSGGPTVNLDGELVGVNSFNISGETEAFNFISPSSLVVELLAQNGVANELGPIDETYRAGIDAYFAGDFQTALDSFEQVLALSPTHQQAEEYRQQAATQLAQNPQPSATGGAEPGSPAAATPKAESGFPMIGIVAIIGAIVVVGGFIAFSLRRKPSPAAPAAPAVGVVPVAPAAAPPAPQAPTPPPLHAVETPATAHFCPNCGQALSAGAKFCPQCGQQIEAA